MYHHNDCDNFDPIDPVDSDEIFYQSVHSPPPCESCQNVDQCHHNNLACMDFVAYVDMGCVAHKCRTPHRYLYVKLFFSNRVEELTLSEIEAIKCRCNTRGVTQKMVADEFYILPQHVRNIVESNSGVCKNG